MVSPNSSDFSFDLYPGLDADLDAAYERNIAQGTASPEDVATSGLAAVVQEALVKAPVPSSETLNPEASLWAVEELMPVLTSWKRYDTHFSSFMPDMSDISRNLVLVPWREMKARLSDFGGWLEGLRETQGLPKDYINDQLLTAIQTDQAIYRTPNLPDQMISMSTYLDRKIEQDGSWGIMLAQTSDEAGIDVLKGQSPDQLTENGEKDFKVAGQQVDAMGIFEWIALTLQENPRMLSSKDYSWLLANRFTDSSGGPLVPFGCWDVGQVGSFLNDADYQYDNTRPRLAVMNSLLFGY
ncbi:hypothetical protein HYS00_02615 [Candidatus Microgenomates bacterium]|nr:hypothetical protein [Candidatus Microgenomates bacterium]